MRRAWHGWVFAAGLLSALGACDERAEDHTPLPASAQSSGPPPPPAAEEVARLEAWAARLRTAEKGAEYGRLDATELGYVIGEVAAVETDRTGNVLILDEQYHDMKVFGPRGEHLVTVSGPGGGPGELRAPSTLDWLAPDTLVITDVTRRAQLFERQSDASFVFLESFPTSVGVEATCVHDGALWVHGFGPDMEHRVHRLDRDGGRLSHSIAQVAPVAPVENEILSRRRALGFMACSESYGLVAITSRYFPDMQVFGFDGTERWSARIPGFTPMEFTVVPGGGLRQGIAKDAGGFHWVVGVELLDPSTVAVQVGWQTAQSSSDGTDYVELVTHLVSMHTGEFVTVEGDLPLIHKMLVDGFLASKQVPFPHVIHYRLKP